jgi:predicted Zn-dependent protease
MKMNIIRHSIFSLIFIFLVSFASAKELKSDELNYIITVPDGWTVTFQNSAGFSVQIPPGKKTVTLLIRNAGFGTLDSNSVAVFEKDLLKGGAQNVSSKNIAIDGIPAFETVYSVGKTPYATSFDDYQIIINNKLYFLGGSASYGDGTQDSEIKEVLASFHFLHPPKLSRFGSLGVKLTVVGIIIAGIVFWVMQSRKI